MLTLTYLNLFKSREVRCENLVLTCMDYRFRKQIGDLLTLAGYPEFDHVALPGGTKALLNDEGRKTFFAALDVGLRLHDTRRVIIVDHIDCGAYGGSTAFAGSDAEEEFHRQRLAEAREVINGAYPEVEVVPAYIDWDWLKPLP